MSVPASPPGHGSRGDAGARPDLAVIAKLALDDRDRMTRQAARMAVAVFRCDRGHLQGFILPTVAGPVVFWRPAWARKARDVWEEEWLDLLPETVSATCHCRPNTPIGLAPYRRPSAVR